MLEHLDQPRLVERRIRVGRAAQGRDAAGERRVELSIERGHVLVARLAQARREIDQPWQHPQAGGVDRALRLEAGGNGAGAMRAT